MHAFVRHSVVLINICLLSPVACVMQIYFSIYIKRTFSNSKKHRPDILHLVHLCGGHCREKWDHKMSELIHIVKAAFIY